MLQKASLDRAKPLSSPLLLVLLGLLAPCASCDRPSADKEIGNNGLVVMNGGQPTDFRQQYLDAADLMEQSNIPAAARIYANLVQKEPGSPNPLVGLGSCEAARGKWAEARTFYEKALEKDANCVTALVGLGSAYDGELNPTNAIPFFQKALSLDSVCAQAHAGLTRVYSEIGDTTNARIHLAQFKKLSPQSHYLEQMEYYIGRWPYPTNNPKLNTQN